MATWKGTSGWNVKAEMAAGCRTGLSQVEVFKQNGGKIRDSHIQNRNGERLRTGSECVGPTPNLPIDIQNKDFAWSRKCRDFNLKYPNLDISHQPGWATADLSFHSKAYDRSAQQSDQIRLPRDYESFRESHGATAELPPRGVYPPTMKQQFSMSNTPLNVTFSNEHERTPTGLRAAFWNIKKATNFSSAQYDIVNPLYPMKDCYKWVYIA